MTSTAMSRDILASLIDADPNQPRRHFDEASLQELADSLRAEGQIVPITVRPVGDRFVIVQGERRWRAAQLAGLPTLRAEVADIAPEASYLLALIENIQRADLTPLEEAAAYQRLLANGFNQTTLGKRIGKSQSSIAQKLRLLKLPAEVQTAIDDGTLSEGHARQLLRLIPSHAPSEAMIACVKELEAMLPDVPKELSHLVDNGVGTIKTLAQHAIAEKWTVDRLWHDVTLDLLVLHPSRDYKLSDLVAFAKKLDTNKNSEGYPEHRLRAEWKVGSIFAFGERVWKKYRQPDIAAALLETQSLADIQAVMKKDEDLNRIGFDLRNLMECASVPKAEMDDLIKRVIDQVDHDPDDDYWDRLHREFFTQVHQTMSRDIVMEPA